jgi:hypothetical protein
MTTFARGGAERMDTWTFTPLRNMRGHAMPRESTADASGRLRRRPLNEREVRTLKIPAGLLLDAGQQASFKLLLRAEKIEWQRLVGGKKQWVEFDLDVEESIVPGYLQDIDPLEQYEIKLVQSAAVWFDEWWKSELQFTDYNS